MDIILFLLTILALAIITKPFLRNEKYASRTSGAILIGSIIATSIGSYRTCRDGWLSSSIGRQGACSHHGGVITTLNDFGWLVLIISLIVIMGFIVYTLYKDRKNKDQNKRKLKET